MSKEAKIKQFKFAFLKPKHPDKEAVKLKTSIEKSVRNSKKKGDDRGVFRTEITTASTKLTNSDRDEYKQYAVELLSYKLTKHWNDDEEFKIWKNEFGNAPTLGSAAEKLLAGNPSDDFVKECADRFMGNDWALDACFTKKPGVVVDHMVAQVKALPKGFGPNINTSVRLCSKVVKKLFLDAEFDRIPDGYLRSVGPDDALEMAKHDPQLYCQVFLKDTLTAENRVSALKNPEVRKEIAKNDTLWSKLKSELPMLGFFEESEKKVDKTGSKKEQELSLAECVFDELLRDGNALNLTYFTNNFTRPDDALAATPKEQAKLLATARENMQKEGYTDMPNQPAAQCDVLVSILTRVMEGALGPNATVKCKPIVIPEMVLTVPLSQLPGPGDKPGNGGLLPKSFGGNVFEDGATTPNGQVFFTGNGVEKPNAHTYLDVDGVLYDAVLGTKGEDVKKAVAEKFANWEKGWVAKDDPGKTLKVAKGDKGNWILEDANLRAPKNNQGFKTGYRITGNIAQYAVKNDA